MEIEIKTTTIPLEVGVEKAGPQGLSAYEVAVKNGFIGTEQEWLDSLVGEKGEKGDKGNTGATGVPGRDGYVQYTAGDNITIENNVISATGGDLSNYYTKSEVDDLMPPILTLNIPSNFSSTQHSISDSTTLNEASKIITAFYNMGIKSGALLIRSTISNISFLGRLMNTTLAEKNGQYQFGNAFAQWDNISISLGARVRINGTWSNNVFTCTAITCFGALTYEFTNYLSKTNTTSYTPTANYHPATKKYVDDSIASAITDALGGEY